MRISHRLVTIVAILVGLFIQAGSALANDSALCRRAVASAEASQHLPDAFLSAIARVESGRPDNDTGTLAPWPWTINAQGHGSFFDSEAAAIAAVRTLQANGVRSIDVGCLQVNLMHHPEAFASLAQAFDPQANAAFAGRLLASLFARTGSWPLAAAAYHSQTPTIGAPYQQRVLAEWAVPDGRVSRQEAPYAASATATRPLQAGLLAAIAPISPPPTPRPAMPGSAFGRSAAFAGRAAPGFSGLPSTGRSLAAYRAMPTALALRLPPRPG